MSAGELCLRAPNWVGDLVMATPVFEAAWRSSRLGAILVRRHLAGMLATASYAERVVPIENAREEIAMYRDLRPAAVALLTNSVGAAWRARRGGVPLRAGSGLGGRRWLLTHAVLPPSRAGRRLPIPTAHLLRDVAGLVGLAVPDLHPRLAIDRAAAAEVTATLARAGIAAGSGYVACAPGAAFGAAKLWPPERFAAALDEIERRHGWRGVVCGGPGESALGEEVVRAARGRAINLPVEARTLPALVALVAGARLLLVGDSGPRWIAAAFDVPCVSVMGPNFPELTASSLERCAIVRVDGLECAPCLERTCPLGHHRCMRDLAVEAVLAAAEDVLARSAR